MENFRLDLTLWHYEIESTINVIYVLPNTIDKNKLLIGLIQLQAEWLESHWLFELLLNCKPLGLSANLDLYDITELVNYNISLLDTKEAYNEMLKSVRIS